MKRILWCAAVAAAMIFVGCGKSPEKKRAISVINLKQIGTGVLSYKFDNNGEFPPDLNGLLKADCIIDPAVFISPSDPVRRVEAKGELRDENTSYVYVAKGLKDGLPEMPLAFEKASVVSATGYCCVLSCDGHVEVVQMTAKSNREIAENLVSRVYPGKLAAEKNLIISNAAEADAREAKAAAR